MDPTKQQISCDDCSSEFEIKFDEEADDLLYCPFCGADLFWDDDEDEDDDMAFLADLEEEYDV